MDLDIHVKILYLTRNIKIILEFLSSVLIEMLKIVAFSTKTSKSNFDSEITFHKKWQK